MGKTPTECLRRVFSYPIRGSPKGLQLFYLWIHVIKGHSLRSATTPPPMYPPDVRREERRGEEKRGFEKQIEQQMQQEQKQKQKEKWK